MDQYLSTRLSSHTRVFNPFLFHLLFVSRQTFSLKFPAHNCIGVPGESLAWASKVKVGRRRGLSLLSVTTTITTGRQQVIRGFKNRALFSSGMIVGQGKTEYCSARNTSNEKMIPGKHEAKVYSQKAVLFSGRIRRRGGKENPKQQSRDRPVV